MTEIKRHFAYSTDSNEIVTDIENRLAEMFNEKLAEQGKQVIILQDVEDITAAMGGVDDFTFGDDEADFQAGGTKSERKLFRDPDDRTVGGVCAGVAHYLQVEVKWVRIITVLITLLWGTGLIVYAILWIILPSAKTRQEKMAMKGEAINLQNLKKNFDEEVEAVRKNFEAARPAINKTGTALTSVIHNLLSFIVKAAMIFIKVIGAIIVLGGVMALLGLVAALIFAMGFWDAHGYNPFPFNIINPEYQSAVYFAAFIILIVPLAALIFFAIRVIFNITVLSRSGSFAMLILWLTGIGMGLYYGSRIASEFKEDARFEQRSDITTYPLLYLKLNQDKFLSREDSIRFHLDSKTFKGRILIDDDDNELNSLTKFDLYIEKSEDGKTSIQKEFTARGFDFEEALKAAQRIRYRTFQQDSVITFDKYLSLTGNGLFRDQEVNVTLRIPLNTKLIIDGKLNPHLHNYNLWDCHPENNSDDTPTEWIMTTEGLKCSIDSLNQR